MLLARTTHTKDTMAGSAQTCVPETCAPTQVANSNQATLGSITGTTGQTQSVTCQEGYSGGGTATCATDGDFNTLTCAAKPCTPAGNVANSNKAATESITGTTTDNVKVTCHAGYSGTGTTNCQPSGTFSTLPTCVECETGRYNDQTHQSSCKNDCSAGSFITTDKTACSLCNKGQWQDQENKMECKKCSPGKVIKTIGQATDKCENCVAGTYNPYEGHDGACLPCETAKTGASTCEGCGPGEHIVTIDSTDCFSDCTKLGFQYKSVGKITFDHTTVLYHNRLDTDVVFC